MKISSIPKEIVLGAVNHISYTSASLLNKQPKLEDLRAKAAEALNAFQKAANEYDALLHEYGAAHAYLMQHAPDAIETLKKPSELAYDTSSP